MKPIIFFLVFITIISSCDSQLNENNCDHKLDGKYHFNHSKYGYSEVVIKDSAVSFMSSATYSSKCKSLHDTILLLESGYDIFLLPQKNDIITVSWNGEVDTLVKVSNIDRSLLDYNCDLKLTPLEFIHQIEIAFQKRAARIDGYDSIHTDTNTIKLSPGLYEQEVSYKTIEAYDKIDSHSGFISLVYTSDSTECVLTFDRMGQCYSDYRVKSLSSNGKLNIYTKQINSGCKDSCVIRHTIKYLVYETRIEEIEINGHKII